MADGNRTIWHLVALVATLALVAVVAVVAVTRDERGGEPGAQGTTTPATTASPSRSPVALEGEGPYVVYARGNSVLAFDVASGQQTPLGTVEGILSAEGSRQPGSGRVVAFTMVDGTVWKVARPGLRRVGTIPPAAGGIVGSAVSLDDRRVAVARTGTQPSIIIVDLQSGRPTIVPRTSRGTYPPEPLLPIAWSLGGNLVYEIPYCECDGGTPGLYALDLASGGSTRLSGTTSTNFFLLAVSQSGQALYYGTGTSRRCRSDESEPCEGPPFYLRRIAAGDAGSDILRRASDYPFFVDAISQDGRLLLVRRPVSEREGARLELYSAEGERQPSLDGVPEGGGTGLAILPDDTYVIRTSTADRTMLLLVRDGAARTIAEATTADTLAYLGWLR